MDNILQNFFIDDLLITKVENIAECINIELESKNYFQECPSCNKISYSIHSKYYRIANDLTLIGKKLVLTIHVNKFKCENQACHTKIFCQRMRGFLEKNQQKTERLLDYLKTVAFTNTGEGGARICQNSNIQVSGDTLIRLVKGWNPSDKKPTKIGVDDWAYKKSHTYGTLIVDLETHCPVDVLKGSDSDTLKKWLEENPQVEIVSRDRGTSYASAANGLIQIADRFHIMQNFLDNVKSIVVKNLPNRILIKEEYMPKSTEDEENHQERTSPNLELRKENAAKAQSLKKLGWKYKQIANEIGVSIRTVSRILLLDVKKMFIKSRGAKPALDNYKDIIQKQLNNGCINNSKIYRILKLEGYNGCNTSVNNYILKMKDGNSKELIKKIYISSNDIIYRIWAGKKFSEEELFILRTKWDQFDYLSEKVRKFRGLIKNKNLDKFDKFISEVEFDKKNIFYEFVQGLKKDIVAIRNALVYEYSNGVLEGSINKLKTIKRMMYGRARYELLRKKILYYNN
jgi:transposase